MVPKNGQTERSKSPEETPDIIPTRQLTKKEVEEDYQKQLALLAKQMKEGPRSQREHTSDTAKATARRG
ncbi:hypothetical protein ACHAPU_010888 [Fusarium lateritium]